jgi:hypothetical protein
VKRIGYLGDSGDRPSSSLLGCTLWIRAFIIKYKLGGNKCLLPLISPKEASSIFGLSKIVLKICLQFLAIAHLIIDLTKKDAFHWSTKEQQAFVRLGEATTSTLVLTTPHFT